MNYYSKDYQHQFINDENSANSKYDNGSYYQPKEDYKTNYDQNNQYLDQRYYESNSYNSRDYNEYNYVQYQQNENKFGIENQSYTNQEQNQANPYSNVYDVQSQHSGVSNSCHNQHTNYSDNYPNKNYGDNYSNKNYDHNHKVEAKYSDSNEYYRPINNSFEDQKNHLDHKEKNYDQSYQYPQYKNGNQNNSSNYHDSQSNSNADYNQNNEIKYSNFDYGEKLSGSNDYYYANQSQAQRR